MGIGRFVIELVCVAKTVGGSVYDSEDTNVAFVNVLVELIDSLQV